MSSVGAPAWASGLEIEERETGTRSVRRAVGASTRDLELVVDALSRQVLANTQELRMIAPALYETATLTVRNIYFIQGDHYLKMFNAKLKKGGEAAKEAGEPWWWVLTGLITAGATDSKLQDEEKHVMTTALAELSTGGPQVVTKWVTICRLKKAYGEGNKKLQLGATHSGQVLVKTIMTGVVKNGGQKKVGQAPRGVNERAIQEHLERMV